MIPKFVCVGLSFVIGALLVMLIWEMLFSLEFTNTATSFTLYLGCGIFIAIGVLSLVYGILGEKNG